MVVCVETEFKKEWDIRKRAGNRYTVISEYEDAHSVAQVSAPSLSQVSLTWLQSGELLKIGLKLTDRKVVYEEGLLGDEPTATDGVMNVWCDSFVINDKLCVLYICQNPSLNLIEKQFEPPPEIYSYISLIRETAYIRQVEMHDAKAADSLWLTGKSPPWYSVESFERSVPVEFEPLDRLIGVFKAVIQSDYGQGVAYRMLTQA